MSGDDEASSWQDSDDARAAQRAMQQAVEAYFKVANDFYDQQYMMTHWVLMAEGIVMNEENSAVVFREPSKPAPSHSKQMGLLRYGLVRLEKEVARDDD